MINIFSDFFINNWYNIIATLGIPLAWIFGGKRKQNLENNKVEQEVKKESASAIEALQSVYDKYIEHDKARTQSLEKRIDSLEEHNRSLQSDFNAMQLSYALVMEESKKWESMYKKLEKEYKDLKALTSEREILIENLTKQHNALKLSFENYKKKHQ